MTDPTPEDVERVALLPCPFCSGEARVFNHLAHWSIACRKCGVAFTQPSQEKVIAAWERRAAMRPRSSTGEQAAHNGRVAGSTPAAATDHSALIRELRDALRGMLSHACVADAAPDDVDEEDRQLERVARAALHKANEALGEKA